MTWDLGLGPMWTSPKAKGSGHDEILLSHETHPNTVQLRIEFEFCVVMGLQV